MHDLCSAAIKRNNKNSPFYMQGSCPSGVGDGDHSSLLWENKTPLRLHTRQGALNLAARWVNREACEQ